MIFDIAEMMSTMGNVSQKLDLFVNDKKMILKLKKLSSSMVGLFLSNNI